jgi:arsenate reductase
MEIEQVAAAFTALGQTTRLELVRTLLFVGPSGLPAGDIAARLNVPPSTLSFHLRALEQAGLIAPTRQGRSLVYAAQINALRSLIGFLTEACCEGEPSRSGDLAQLFQPMAKDLPVFNVLFLCTHNSARSILAEALLNKIGKGRFQAFSAGSDPSPSGPLPEVISQLRALGHEVSSLRSKTWQEFTGPDAPRMDFVITLCDILAGQTCPEFGDAVTTAAWPMPDPMKFSGNAAERATLLNEVYAGLRRRLEAFSALPIAALDRMSLKARLDKLAEPYVGAR